MKDISALRKAYVHFKYAGDRADACVNWAIERLQNHEESDDADIKLLAGSLSEDEVQQLVPRILEKYLGGSPSEEYYCGQYIVELRLRHLAGEISIMELEPILWRLFTNLSSPDWLVMLSRNCEYATDVEAFRKPFEDEFEYIAGLWETASSYEDFIRNYDRDVSNQHDYRPHQ